LANHLFRLGHSSGENGVLSLDSMAKHFTVKHLGRAPARFEESQLNVWQREVAHHMPLDESERWLSAETPADIDGERRRAFIQAIRPNVLLPKDVAHWREVVFGPTPALEGDALARVREAGPKFFRAAADAAASDPSLDAIVTAVKAATGAKGQALWKPLRLALTGTQEGPELAPLLKAMAGASIHERLIRFAA
jgi:glutamyl-tRNA synthetase